MAPAVWEEATHQTERPGAVEIRDTDWPDGHLLRYDVLGYVVVGAMMTVSRSCTRWASSFGGGGGTIASGVVMLMCVRHLGLLVAVVAAGLARPAAAQSTAGAPTVRETRRVSLGFSPAWPWNAAHDATAPLPALRLSVNLSPRLALDLTAGRLQYSDFGGWSLVDLGARWFLADGNGSPYLLGRIGGYFVDGDETPDETFGYVTLGAGLEYACDCGFTAWAELGPALIGSDWGAYASAGLGYRFGSAPP